MFSGGNDDSFDVAGGYGGGGGDANQAMHGGLNGFTNFEKIKVSKQNQFCFKFLLLAYRWLFLY